MSEIIFMILVFIGGVILGVVFFGGLWLTVQKSVRSKTPALMFILSFIMRTGVVILGFYFLSSGDWKKLFACLFGFIFGRIVVKQITNSEKEKQFNRKEPLNET
jgi:F1F0 ATPase subunit 2